MSSSLLIAWFIIGLILHGADYIIFHSFHWDIPRSVDAAILLATQKFVPSCKPRLFRPTSWWNRECETAWQKKMEL